MIRSQFIALLFIFTLMLHMGCNEDQKIPDISVEEYVYLSSAKYESLKYIGGYAVIEDAGVRGILVYYSASGVYKAYEMICPQISDIKPCSLLEPQPVQQQLKCPCDETFFSMETGFPIDTKKNTTPLKTYKIQKVNEVTLLITN